MRDLYGPNTAEVEKLLEQIRAITPEQITAITPEQITALEGAVHNVRNARRITAAITKRPAWKEAWPVAWEAWNASWATRGVLGTVWEVVYYAVLAVVVKDLLIQEDFDALYGPWASVMEVEK